MCLCRTVWSLDLKNPILIRKCISLRPESLTRDVCASELRGRTLDPCGWGGARPRGHLYVAKLFHVLREFEAGSVVTAETTCSWKQVALRPCGEFQLERHGHAAVHTDWNLLNYISQLAVEYTR